MKAVAALSGAVHAKVDEEAIFQEELGETDVTGPKAETKASTDWPISRDEEPALFEMLDELIRDEHPVDCEHVRICLAWHSGWHPDTDGNMKFAETRKLSELMQRITGFDFIITLNADFWREFKVEQKRYILDHELTHIGPKIGENGEQVTYIDGMRIWRMRTHDVGEFSDVVERHGFLYPRIREFARSIMAARKKPLFAAQLDESDVGEFE